MFLFFSSTIQRVSNPSTICTSWNGFSFVLGDQASFVNTIWHGFSTFSTWSPLHWSPSPLSSKSIFDTNEMLMISKNTKQGVNDHSWNYGLHFHQLSRVWNIRRKLRKEARLMQLPVSMKAAYHERSVHDPQFSRGNAPSSSSPGWAAPSGL